MAEANEGESFLPPLRPDPNDIDTRPVRGLASSWLFHCCYEFAADAGSDDDGLLFLPSCR